MVNAGEQSSPPPSLALAQSTWQGWEPNTALVLSPPCDIPLSIETGRSGSELSNGANSAVFNHKSTEEIQAPGLTMAAYSLRDLERSSKAARSSPSTHPTCSH